VGKSIQARLDWLPSNVLALIEAVSPLSVAQQVIGTLVAQTLCANQVADPGDLALGDLLWDLAGAAIPNPNGSPGTLGWWIGQKLSYYAFFEVCQCSGTLLPPPAPVTPAPPGGSEIYPTAPQDQPQLTRIENNQGTSGDALKTLYHMGQYTATTLGDLWVRNTNSLVTHGLSQPIAMQDEGRFDIPPVDFGFNAITQDLLGIAVVLTNIPSTVKRRGVTYQRLYGVGSVEWDVHDPRLTDDLIGQRDALHYERQFILAPQRVQSYRFRWRLQPGVMANAYLVDRSVDNPFYTGPAPYNQAYQWFYNWQMPPNWHDPPIYPQTGLRAAPPGGGGLPPAPFPCCS
jgi:hypothetical protein